MIKLVIFDLDGTLLNTLEDLKTCTNHVLKQHGFPEHPLNQYRYFVGNGIPVLIKRALPEGTPKETVQMVLSDFFAYYDLHKADLTAPYEGIVELLEYLQDHKVMLAVASNKIDNAVAPLMDYYFPTIRFVSALGSREGVLPKPDPTIVEDILKIAKVEKSEVLYVGDTAVDMDTAHNAGLTAVGVLWGFRDLQELRQAKAEYIISNPAELKSLL